MSAGANINLCRCHRLVDPVTARMKLLPGVRRYRTTYKPATTDPQIGRFDSGDRWLPAYESEYQFQ
jgi:hypothetical protein